MSCHQNLILYNINQSETHYSCYYKAPRRAGSDTVNFTHSQCLFSEFKFKVSMSDQSTYDCSVSVTIKILTFLSNQLTIFIPITFSIHEITTIQWT